VLFELTKTDTTYTLYVYGSGVFGNNFDQVFVYLFSDTITPTTEDDCTETQSGSNDRSCGSLTSQSGGPGVLWFFMSGANGGSVTLEAGDAT